MAWVVLALWVTAAQALTPRFEAIGEAGGLRDAAVSALALDARGFLWVGMPDGLQRFDGYVFKRYPLGTREDGASDQFVRALLADPRGGMWVAAGNSGLARLDPASGQWVRWARTNASAADAQAPVSNSVRALALEADGTLWVGTQGGLSRLDARQQGFTHLRGRDSGLPDDRIASLLLDRHGTLWIGSWQGLARKLHGSDRIEPVDLGLERPQITLLAETRDGRVLVGTGRGDLRMLSPDARALPFASHAGGDEGSWPVLSMVQVGDGELWLGGRTGVERRRASDGTLIERLPPEGGSPGVTPRSEVRTLLRDPAGVIWVGSYGSGLMRHVPPLPGLSLVKNDLALWRRFGDLDVRSVLQLQDRSIWLGTQSAGVLRLNEALEPVGGFLDGGPQRTRLGRIAAMAQTPAGAIWLSVENELMRVDASGRWLQSISTGQVVTRRLLSDRQGTLWLGTSDGLWRLSPGSPAPEPVRLAGRDKRSSGEVNALVQLPDGSLWAGGAAGLLRVAQPLRSGLPEAQLMATEGLVGHTVVGLGVDREGHLWVDTSAGLHRLQSSSDDQARFESFPAASGDEVVGAFGANLLADRDGRIWTHRGLFDPRSGMHRDFTPVDGADIGNGWFRAYAALADGRFVFGGARGLLVAQPELFAPWTYQPPVVATELRVGNQSRPLPASGQTLDLAPGQRSFSLSFAALDYSQPARNRYRYRLDGLDDEWQDASATERSASYTNLDPGRYRLHVQGSNRDGAWSPHELQFDIRVDAAWWQWRSVQLLAALALLAVLLGVVRLRMRLLLRRQQRLETRVAEATAALQQKSRELEEASLTDPLTGLRNRRFIEQHLPADVALALRRHESAEQYGHRAQAGTTAADADLLIFLVDIDHFKRINDSHGHMAGDAVLMQMRGRLQQVFRAADYLVRWGGEEFLIVARGTPREQALELAERARQAVAGEDFVLEDGQRLSMTCSVGFSAFPLAPQWPRALDWRAAIDLTDCALYAAKEAGRNAWVGLLKAEAPDEEQLRRDSRLALSEWAASGRLTLLKSR